ncbi:MAG: DUF1003 domain-containing protein [Gammaproteobacteria bacterium]|nr:DUF1003 domain-containing protein [Gammaproteobacteria bacterium]
MKEEINKLAREHLGSAYKDLEAPEQKVINSIVDAEPIVENVNTIFHEQLSFGQRLADKISTFGGSWTFIIIFLSILVVWMAVNSFLLVSPKQPFDPYPYILLNLMLSTIAALQAPVIMMSQNRQTQKDRLDITENYKVSLKTDLEITRLHQKIDELSKILIAINANDDRP